MLNWWNGISLTEQIFACVAAAATAVMLAQSLLLLFGIGFGGDSDAPDGGDVDADLDSGFDGGADSSDSDGHFDGSDHDGLSLFTVRGIVAFFAIGGWSGLLAAKYLQNAWAILIAFVAGTAALVGIAYIFKAAYKLQDRGNLDVANAVGKTGKVYIPIPEAGKGQGKITVLMQERLVELDAVTSADRILKTGELVRIAEALDEGLVSVEPQNTADNNKGGISQWIQS